MSKYDENDKKSWILKFVNMENSTKKGKEMANTGNICGKKLRIQQKKDKTRNRLQIREKYVVH